MILFKQMGGSRQRWVFLATLGALVFFAPIVSLAAFGISPPYMNADHLVPGAKFRSTIFLVQDQPLDDVKIKTELQINDRVKSWISINDGKEIVIPKGVRQFGVPIEVNVPKDAELGAYGGKVTFVTAPDSAGQVTIALAVQAAINLIIGDDIYRNFRIAQIRFPDIEEGWSPRVFVKFDNQGNIPEQLEGATLEVLDKFGGVRLAYVPQIKGKFPEVKPFTFSEELMEFPIDLHLGVGQYWGSVSFSKGGEVVASQRSIFNVVKAGTLSNPWVIITQHLSFYRNYYIVSVLILALGWVVFYKRKKLRFWR